MAFIPKILRFESLPSTNVEAARQAGDGAAEGLCIVAGEQTAGRGRLQREWISPKDSGLYFSIVFRPQFEQNAWSLLTLMAAVAVNDALREACSLETDIKWPNDVLANDRKLCGILAETVETPGGRAVVVGVGINLTKQALPEELGLVATSVETATGRRHELETLLEYLIIALEKYYAVLTGADGREKIIGEWSARSSYAEGKLVQVVESNKTLLGTTRGLERDGALRVETITGIRIVHAGDVTNLRPNQELS